MLKLYFYGYRHKVRSSRKLMELSHVNIEARWLIHNLQPDFRSISDFRKNNGEPIKKAFVELNKLYHDWDLLAPNELSQDGVKIRANNSKDKNFTLNKLDDRISKAKKRIAEYLMILEREDTLDDEIASLKEEIKTKEERIKRFQGIRDKIVESGKSQISFTDPDSNLMLSNGSFFPSYNVQVSLSSISHLVAGFTVTTHPADIGSLSTLSLQIKDNFNLTYFQVTTDKGYFDREDMLRSLENGIYPNVNLMSNQSEFILEDTYVPNEITEDEKKSSEPNDIKKCIQAAITPDIYKDKISKMEVVEKNESIDITEPTAEQDENDLRDFAMKNNCFTRHIKDDKVFCPQGQILRPKNKNAKQVFYTNKLACKNCKNKCTNCPFKRVAFSENQTISAPKNSKITVGRKIKQKRKVKKVLIHLIPDYDQLKKRMGTSEHVHGSMKRWDDASYFLLRTKDKVEIEAALYYSVFNMRRVTNILGVSTLLMYIRLKKKGINLSYRNNSDLLSTFNHFFDIIYELTKSSFFILFFFSDSLPPHFYLSRKKEKVCESHCESKN